MKELYDVDTSEQESSQSSVPGFVPSAIERPIHSSPALKRQMDILYKKKQKLLAYFRCRSVQAISRPVKFNVW